MVWGGLLLFLWVASFALEWQGVSVAPLLLSFPLAKPVWQRVTWLGLGGVDAGLFGLLFLLGWLRSSDHLKRVGIVGASAVGASGLLVQIVKHIFCRARPHLTNAGEFFNSVPCLFSSHGFASFPSGHATAAFAAAVTLAWAFPRWRVLFWGAAAAVGLSRVALEVHFPSDVVAGALLGSMVGLLACRLVPLRLFWRRQQTVCRAKERAERGASPEPTEAYGGCTPQGERGAINEVRRS